MVQALRTVISPGRYVQGKGAIHQLGDYLKNLGSTPADRRRRSGVGAGCARRRGFAEGR